MVATPVLAQIAATPDGAVRLFGVTLVGVSATTGVKLLFTLVLVVVVMALRAAALALGRLLLGGEVADSRRFWARQGIQVVAAVVVVLGTVSIWVTPGTNISTAVGLVTAALAFALQQPVLSLAAYVVILRGDTFGVGDRVVLAGVRGDVVRLGFLRTTIMEMGLPPAAEAATDQAAWVQSRQYSGRLVTVANAAIFDDPVYNYSRDFPFLWEEIALPVAYTADRDRVEGILLDAARAHAVGDTDAAAVALALMRSRYAMADAALEPTVYWRITDNWLEMTVRFLVPDHGARAVKDRVTRDVLAGLDAAGIEVASATYEIVGLPPLRTAATPTGESAAG